MRLIKHPGHLLEATTSTNRAVKLMQDGLLPLPIQVFMLVTPIKRQLRAIYGRSDLAVALILLFQAIAALPARTWFMAEMFWMIKVRRKDPQRILENMASELEDMNEDIGRNK